MRKFLQRQHDHLPVGQRQALNCRSQPVTLMCSRHLLFGMRSGINRLQHDRQFIQRLMSGLPS